MEQTDDQSQVDVLRQIAGKRIRYVLRWRVSPEESILLVFTDFSCCVLKSREAMSLTFTRIDKPEVDNLLAEARQSGNDVEVSFDPDEFQKREMSQLLHSLWTKASGTDYDKAQWKRLADFLAEMGVG